MSNQQLIRVSRIDKKGSVILHNPISDEISPADFRSPVRPMVLCKHWMGEPTNGHIMELIDNK